jgi:hypothetical protein
MSTASRKEKAFRFLLGGRKLDIWECIVLVLGALFYCFLYHFGVG